MAKVNELFARAIRLHKQGAIEKAKDLYEQILDINPGHADCLSNLGMILRQKGQKTEALSCQQKAARLDPKDGNKLSNLGNIYMDLGQYSQAEAAYKQAIDLNPKNIKPYLNLGDIYRLQRRYSQARSCFLKAAEIEPESSFVLLNLGNISYELGQLEAAADYYNRSIEKNPKNAQAHQNLAAVEKSLGELDLADEYFRKAISLNSNHLSAYYNLVHLRKCRLNDPIFDHLFELENKKSLSAREEIQLFFSLGKLYADNEEPDRAFEYYKRGNRARQREASNLGRHFDPDSHSNYIDRLIRTFDTSFFKARKDLGSSSEKPVLIVGMPRSGTTLVEQILSSHPDVFGAGELEYIFNLQQYAGSLDQMAALDKNKILSLANEYLRHIENLANKETRIVDKMPENFLRLGLFALLFPRARIIHCTRSALDTCISCFFHNFTEAHEYTNDLMHLGSFYLDYQRLMDHWNNVLPNPILEVCYEKLLDSPEKYISDMISFCGLNWDDRCLKFYDNKRAVKTASNVQVRQPLYKSSLNRWETYSRHIQPLKEILGMKNQVS